MNLLKEISTLVGMRFVRSDQPVESRTTSCYGLFVQLIASASDVGHLYCLVVRHSLVLTDVVEPPP